MSPVAAEQVNQDWRTRRQRPNVRRANPEKTANPLGPVDGYSAEEFAQLDAEAYDDLALWQRLSSQIDLSTPDGYVGTLYRLKSRSGISYAKLEHAWRNRNKEGEALEDAQRFRSMALSGSRLQEMLKSRPTLPQTREQLRQLLVLLIESIGYAPERSVTFRELLSQGEWLLEMRDTPEDPPAWPEHESAAADESQPARSSNSAGPDEAPTFRIIPPPNAPPLRQNRETSGGTTMFPLESY